MFIHEVHMETISAATSQRRPKREPSQSIYAVEIADALLKIKTVIEVTGDSESSIRRGVRAGTFPAPVKNGTRCTRWVAGDITNYLRSRAKVAE